MINNTVLVGRLTKDPELRYTPNGVAVARFTLAVNRPFTNASGERDTDFISCVVWRKPAENVANFLKKGSLAGVVGRIETGSFEGQDGKRVYTTDVVAETVQFLEPKNAGTNAGGGASTAPTPPAEISGGSPQGEPNPFEGQPIDVSDDDLPF